MTVKFPIPAGLSYVSSHTSNYGGSYDPGAGVWTLGNVGVGSYATLAITAKVNTGTAGTVLTTAATIVLNKANVDVNPVNM